VALPKGCCVMGFVVTVPGRGCPTQAGQCHLCLAAVWHSKPSHRIRPLLRWGLWLGAYLGNGGCTE